MNTQETKLIMEVMKTVETAKTLESWKGMKVCCPWTTILKEILIENIR